MKPKVVVFDVIETLFALEPLEEKLKAVGLSDRSLQVWFPRLLRDAFALEVSGEYKTFRQVASATLRVLMSEQNVDPARSTIDEIINGFANLPAHPDVKPALEILRGAGVPIVALTNGSAETTKKMFANAGLQTFIERCISIDEVKHWKPAREVYLRAAKMLGFDPVDIALVAAHDWDIHGANKVGLITGFVARQGQQFSAAMKKPDVIGASLEEVAKKLLDLQQSCGSSAPG
jgi:2-haloacid dehalogenase